MLLIKGLSHKAIATLLAVGEWTVWEQARSIYSKAGLPAAPGMGRQAGLQKAKDTDGDPSD